MSDRTVDCEVEYKPVRNEKNRYQPGVRVICSRCGHTEESYGESSRSVKRCLSLMSENCPPGENNYYRVEDRYLEDD